MSVLKTLADLHELTLGDLLEGIVLHAFDGKVPFSEQSLEKIRALKQVFGLDLSAEDSHLLTVAPSPSRDASFHLDAGAQSARDPAPRILEGARRH